MTWKYEAWFRILRGTALALVGAAVIGLSGSCAQAQRPSPVPDAGEKIVYSDTRYRIVQEKVRRKASSRGGYVYVFVPLTLRVGGDSSIIFSSYLHVKAYAMPSGEECPAANTQAIEAGKAGVADFRLFDGIVYAHTDTKGWMAFEVPEDSTSLHIDLTVGSGEGDILSFDCQL